MTLGVVLLAHGALDRAEHLARLWSSAGCPVVVHVDAKTSDVAFQAMQGSLQDNPLIRFCKRHRCEWGMWGLVAATQSAAEMLLDEFEQVRHVYLSSGSCLPLRPIRELQAYLAMRPQTDFIESVAVTENSWTVGGLSHERFTLRFPFSWKKRRRLFDRYVSLQRRLGVQRKRPSLIEPHLGSQWWCLTRQTLSAILDDPNRAKHDAYFKKVWIPDESYFQSLARLYSTQIESRSLTLSKFDSRGKPHVFYDDHLQLLRRSGCFVARKIWPGADRLYKTFPNNRGEGPLAAEPNATQVATLFEQAVERRKVGRPGLYMQSRFLHPMWENGVTAAPYSVFQGFSDLFTDFEPCLAEATGCTVHGHLFAKERVEFAGREETYIGAISDSARLRDYNPQIFLTNLIWATRGTRQCFQYGPRDNQANNWLMAKDPNAQISVITGAWAVPLFKSNRNFFDIRCEAAALQDIEADFLNVLRSPWVKARVRIWSLAEFVNAPMGPLQTVATELAPQAKNRLSTAPRMRKMEGFGQFLQNLKNQGVDPYLTGHFPVTTTENHPPKPPQRLYIVR